MPTIIEKLKALLQSEEEAINQNTETEAPAEETPEYITRQEFDEINTKLDQLVSMKSQKPGPPIDTGVNQGAPPITGPQATRPLTREDVKNMSEKEISDRWDEVTKIMNTGV